MVRNYKRKTTESWSKVDLLEALVAIKEAKLRVNEASRVYNISRATLYRQYTRFINNGAVEDPDQFRTCGGSPILTKVEERVFVDTILTLRTQGNRVSSAEVKRICFEYCEANGIPNQFHPIKRMASDDWYYGFLKRHPEVRIPGEGKKVAVKKAPDAKDNAVDTVDELIGIVKSGKTGGTKEAVAAAPKLIPPDAPAPAGGKLKKPLKRLGQVKTRTATKKQQDNPLDEQDKETELIVEKEVVVEAESSQEQMEEDDVDDSEGEISSHHDTDDEEDEEEEMLEEEEYDGDDEDVEEEEEEGDCALEDIKKEPEDDEEEEDEGDCALEDIKEEPEDDEEGDCALKDIKEEPEDDEEGDKEKQ